MQFHSKSSFLCWTLILFGILSILDPCHSMSVEIEEEANFDLDSTDSTTEEGDADTSTDDDTTTVTTTTTTTTAATTENDVGITDDEVTEAGTTSEPLKPMMTWTETLMVLSNKGSAAAPAESKKPKKDEINDAVDKAVEALQNIKRVWKKHDSNHKKKIKKISKPMKEDNVKIGVKADQPFNIKANVEKNGKVKQVQHNIKSESSPDEYSHQMSFIFSPTIKSDEPEKSDFVKKGAEFLRYAWERFKENKYKE